MAKGVKKEIRPRTLPKGMSVEQMEEVFTDRLANLIVRLLDYRYEQKMKVKTNENNETVNKSVNQ